MAMNTTITPEEGKEYVSVRKLSEFWNGQSTGSPCAKKWIQDFVNKNQYASVSIVKNPLTNINGRELSNYTADRGTTSVGTETYDTYTIKYGATKLTEEKTRDYMEYMTGQRSLPVYNYEKPENSFFIFEDFSIWKPQYDSSNGLLLFSMGVISPFVPGSGEGSAVQKGGNNVASGENSLAEGYSTVASGKRTHTTGSGTKAIGDYSSAEGVDCIANGTRSHAEGDHTRTSNKGEHAEGVYNKSNSGNTAATNTQHSIGIGSSNQRKNAFEVMQNGDAYLYGVGNYVGTATKSEDRDVKTVKEVIDGKQDTLVGIGAGQNIKTINGNNILGTGDITISGSGAYIMYGIYNSDTRKWQVPQTVLANGITAFVSGCLVLVALDPQYASDETMEMVVYKDANGLKTAFNNDIVANS